MGTTERLREALTAVVLALLGLRVVATLVVSLRDPGQGAGQTLAGLAADPLTLVLLAALVGWCLRGPRTPHALRLAVASLVVAALAVLLAVVGTALWLSAAGDPGAAELTRVLLGLLLSVAAVVALAVLRSGAAQQPAPVAAGPEALPAADTPAELPATEEDRQREPTWQPDQASGAAWLTAGDAATGAAAVRWGAASDRGGWVAEPERDPEEPGSDPPRTG